MENRSAGKLGKRDLGIILAVIAIAIAVFALVPDWVTYLETHEDIRVALASYLGWVRQWWAALVAVVAVVVVLVVPRFRGRVIGGFKALGRALQQRFKALGRAAQGVYLRVLWRLVVRPARDHLGVRVSVLMPGSDPREDWARRAAIANLSTMSVELLWDVLNQYERLPGKVVRIGVKGDQGAMDRACDDLITAGFLRQAAWMLINGLVVEVVLAEFLTATSMAREAVAEWVTQEMEDRGEWEAAS